MCLPLQALNAQSPPAVPSATPILSAIPNATPAFKPIALPSPKASPSPTKSAPKKVAKFTPKQEPGKVFPDILKQADTQPLSITISLSKQRVYLLVGGQVAVDSPISSGKKGRETPKGEYAILEKELKHESNLYGDFVNEKGVVVKKGICVKTDIPPAGTHYWGASMKYFMRLTAEGVGMHAGYLPGYPASHGCIRLPLEMAKIIYTSALVNTPVSVTD